MKKSMAVLQPPWIPQRLGPHTQILTRFKLLGKEQKRALILASQGVASRQDSKLMAGFWPPIVGNPTMPLVALTKIHTSSVYPFSLLPKVVSKIGLEHGRETKVPFTCVRVSKRKSGFTIWQKMLIIIGDASGMRFFDKQALLSHLLIGNQHGRKLSSHSPLLKGKVSRPYYFNVCFRNRKCYNQHISFVPTS